LFYRGTFFDHQLRKSRVVENEIVAAIREHGIATIDAVEAVILETDGTFSVVRRGNESTTVLDQLRPQIPKGHADSTFQFSQQT
jgi:uncharacterized membrane protein YcaP (DUF421 family)